MKESNDAEYFLSRYDENVFRNACILRDFLLNNLPDIIEQVDLPARMIGYCYGRKYSELICTLIPSKKGLKLGFNRGTELPDPYKLLKGKGKISRYLEIGSEEEARSEAVQKLIILALHLYRGRLNKVE